MGKWEELKRLAEMATPGPWRAIDYGSYDGSEECWYVETSAGPADIFDAMDGTIEPNHWNPARGKADMQFIAAANPAIVLALIAENERLQAERDQFSAEAQQLDDFSETLGLEIAEAGKREIAHRAERDQLRAEVEALRAVMERVSRWVNTLPAGTHAATTIGQAIDAAMGKGGRADG